MQNEVKIQEITIRKRNPTPLYGYGRRRNPPHGDRSVIYFDVIGETIMENLENRRSRPYTLYRKLFLPSVMQTLGAVQSLDIVEDHVKFAGDSDVSKERFMEINFLVDQKLNWNQKAGCTMCPCSPGFLLEEHHGFDIWVSIATDDEYTAYQQRQVERMKKALTRKLDDVREKISNLKAKEEQLLAQLS